MRIRYEQLRSHPNVLLSLTGLRPAEFEHLVADVRPLLAVAERTRLTRSPRRPLGERKRAIGGGLVVDTPLLYLLKSRYCSQ